MGYPRVYLFNLPLFMVFFGSGLVWLGRTLADRLPRLFKEPQAVYLLAAVFLLPQGYHLFSQYYPSLKTFDGQVYKERLESYTNPDDLILVSDVVHYLYARPVFKDRLMNIMTSNRLSGIKVVSADRSILENLKLNDGGKGFSVFEDIKGTSMPPEMDLVEGRKLFSIPSLDSRGVAMRDFEVSVDWELIEGEGRWFTDTENKFEGDGSLALIPVGDQEMMLRGKLPQVHIQKKSYLVFFWGGHHVGGNNLDGSIFVPAIGFTRPVDPDVLWQVRVGRVNQGMVVEVQDLSEPYRVGWSIGATLGILPPGDYDFSIIVKAFPGKPVLYDGMKFFLLEMG
ncbi:MAG: hypothetical protein IID18_01920 [Nitrospinae bacterium]|nr:hypothetical protein [Nitrospinota bacterium]